MRRRGSRAALIAVLLLGLIIFGAVYFAWNTASAIFEPVSATGPGKTVKVVIQNGESTQQIADQLQADGLIRNALAFRIWARIKGLDTHLQAGVYTNLNSSMTISDIIDSLLNAQPDEYIVRIPDGWRIQQIANQFASQGLVKFNKQQFLQYTLHPNQFPDGAKYPILKSIPPGDSMEGLLFPDTYYVPVNADTTEVINQMLTEFQNMVKVYHLDTEAHAHHMTTYQMVILASLVEREVAFTQDMPGVASVYWNRVNKPNDETVGLLDADPTVQYARDSQPGTTVYWKPLSDVGDNIAPNSPWNTYTHKGWPPTPICSPNLASMEAAAAPPSSNYYFFLAKKDGHIVFAATQAEFTQDEQKYLP
jgi:UPF0755 protein